MSDPLPPHDLASERAVLGVLVRAPELLGMVPHLRREHLYDGRSRDLFDAVQAANATPGVVPDVHVVREKLELAGTLGKVGGLPVLFGLVEAAPLPVNLLWHVERVVGAAHRRDALTIGQKIGQVAAVTVDDDDFRERIADQARLLADLAGLSPVVSQGVPDGLILVGAFLDEPEPADDWVIPGLLARMDRVIVVAAEGRGKSYLARMIAACVAAGRHPFQPELSIPPQRTLIVDLENPPRVIRSGLRRVVDPLLREGAWQDDRAWLYSRPGGMNLRRATDAALLERVVAEVRPALICLGPLYKAFMEAGDRAEQAAGEVAAVLDRIREKYRCALWLEHHAPMEQAGQRPLRPFGSGLWSRWAEFGVSLKVDMVLDPRGRTVKVERFRGDRDAREWPAGLTWGPPDGQPWRALSVEELAMMAETRKAAR